MAVSSQRVVFEASVFKDNDMSLSILGNRQVLSRRYHLKQTIWNLVRTHRVGANPERSDLASFRGPD